MLKNISNVTIKEPSNLHRHNREKAALCIGTSQIICYPAYHHRFWMVGVNNIFTYYNFCFAVVVVVVIVDAVWFIVFFDRQLFGVMNEVMSNDPACSQRCLRLKTYQVIPMTPRWMIYSFIFYPLTLLAVFLIKWCKGAFINWHAL